jgi:hypothetical protein
MAYFIKCISDNTYSSYNPSRTMGARHNLKFDTIPFCYRSLRTVRGAVLHAIDDRNRHKKKNINIPQRVLDVYQDISDYYVIEFDYQSLSVIRSWPLKEILENKQIK